MDRNKKVWLLCMLVALMITVVAACGENKDKSDVEAGLEDTTNEQSEGSQVDMQQERIVKHSFGETVIEGEPNNIISLHPWINDYLLTLEITPHATVSAGPNNSEFSWYYEPYLENTINLGWQIPETNLEAILDSNPDLIIASQNQEQVYDQLTKIADTISIEPVEDEQGIRRMGDTFRKLAEMLDKSEQAELALAEYEEKKMEARGQVKEAIEDETVMFLRMTDKELRYYSKSLFEVLYDDLALTPPLLIPDSSTSFEVLSVEKLPEVDPDHIFLLVESEEKRSDIENLSIWKELKAVENNHVYLVDYDLWFQGFGPIASDLILEDAVEKLTN